jgi:hypothetical protein
MRVRPAMSSRLCVALVLLVLGCGGGESSGPSDAAEVDGSWSGRVTAPNGQTATLTITLSENNRDISGTGSLAFGGSSLGLSVSGSHTPPNVSLTISSQGFEPMTLEASVADARMEGALDGSGFQNRAITLRRQ